VVHQQAGFDHLAVGTAGQQRVACRQLTNWLRRLASNTSAATKQCIGACCDRPEGFVDLADGAGLDHHDLQAERPGGLLNPLKVDYVAGALAGFTSRAIRVALGSSSCRSASRLEVA
jgi:hypothetical protein